MYSDRRRGKGKRMGERELKLTGSQQKLALSLLMDLWRLCPQKQTSVIFKPDLLKTANKLSLYDMEMQLLHHFTFTNSQD